MALPTVDEIRERARELFYARLPPEIRATVPPPEDYELKETGLWHEAQRELMAGEHRKIEEELERWEEFAEPEKVELRQRIKAFDVTLDALKRSLKEVEEKLKAPPPTVEVKPRFTIGERVKHDVHGEGVVRAVRWNAEKKFYEALVEFGEKKIWAPEPELWKVVIAPPPKPPEVKPPVKPPRPPRVPRVPVAPPRPIEEIAVSPITGKPLERVIHIRVITPEISQEPIPWHEMTQEQRRQYELRNQVPTREVTIERVEMVEVPSGMLFFFDRADGRYFEVVDYTLTPISYDKIIERVRRVMRPIIPRRGPAAPLSILREAQLHVREVETDPEFQKYVLEEVGLEWATYLRQDAWTKKAIRDEFIKARGMM